MQKRRGFFEFIKDIFVSMTTAIGTAIEAFYQVLTKGSYTNDQSRLNKLIDDLKIEKANSAAPIQVFNNKNNKEIFPPVIEKYNDLDEYKKTIMANVDNIINTHIDDFLNKKSSSHIFVSGAKEYIISSTLDENNSTITVTSKENNKKIYSADIFIEKDAEGNNVLGVTNEQFHIKALEELDIIDKSNTVLLSHEEFFDGIQSKAESAISNNKRFFEFNGHIFDTRKNETGQVIVFACEAKGVLVGKWAEGNSLYSNGHKIQDISVIESLCYKGQKKFNETTPLNKKEFEEQLKKYGIKLKTLTKKQVIIGFFDKKNNQEKEIKIDLTTGKSTGWLPLVAKAYIVNNITSILQSSKENAFNVEQLQEAIKNNDTVAINEELNKLQTTTEMANALGVAKNNFIVNEYISNKQNELNNNIISFLQNASNASVIDFNDKLTKLLQPFDNIDALTNCKNLVFANENIANTYKERFQNTCIQKVSQMKNRKSALNLTDDLTTSKLKEYSQHFDKDFAEKAKEEYDKIIKDASDFVFNKGATNNQEELSEKLPFYLKRIDDIESLTKFKETLDGYFFSDSFEDAFNVLYNEKFQSLSTDEILQDNSVFDTETR